MNLVSRLKSETGLVKSQNTHGTNNLQILDEPAYTEQEIDQLLKDKEFSEKFNRNSNRTSTNLDVS